MKNNQALIEVRPFAPERVKLELASEWPKLELALMAIEEAKHVRTETWQIEVNI